MNPRYHTSTPLDARKQPPDDWIDNWQPTASESTVPGVMA